MGLTLGRLRFDPAKTKILKISSPLVTNQKLRIQAVGIPLKTYYRMDAELAAGQSFTWPVGQVLGRKRLTGDKLGLVGMLQDRKDTFVPLALDNVQSKDIFLTMRAAVDVDSVQWRHSKFNTGICGKLLPWNELASINGFSSGQGIEIQLPENNFQPLCFEVAALPKNSGTWMKRFFYIHMTQGL